MLQYMYFKIWNKNKDLIGKDFDIEVLCDNEYITTQIL